MVVTTSSVDVLYGEWGISSVSVDLNNSGVSISQPKSDQVLQYVKVGRQGEHKGACSAPIKIKLFSQWWLYDGTLKVVLVCT